MCGIVTLVTPPERAIPTRLLHKLTAIVRHRGPDDEGYAWVDPRSGQYKTWNGASLGDEPLAGILFGHCRLSILDLSSAGHQPLVSDDGSLVLSYNGEIYNFTELRVELEAHGVRFRGHSDTEVLLRAYEQWGEAVLDRLNGMWAFTLWDGRRQTLLASRDRFGVKPLYFTQVDGTWVFASEIKAILGYPGAHRGVRPGNVLEFLVKGVTDHAEETLFADVRTVPPGSCLELAAGRLKQRRFWTLKGAELDGGSEVELVKRLRDLLADSVRMRMRCDVSTGTMLSSGLDSSSIAACVQAWRRQGALPTAGPGSEGSRTFHHAFTACWPGSSLNEEVGVESLARLFGLSLHKYYPSGEDTAALLPKVAYFLDEPFSSPIPIVQYVLMGMAKAEGITVVLNGHGSDESLAGYANTLAPPFLAGLLLSGRLPSFFKERQSFLATGELSAAGIVMAVGRQLLPSRLQLPAEDLLRQQAAQRTGIFMDAKHFSARYDPVALAHSRELPPLSSSLWLLFSQRLLPSWLRMEDRMSMARSVESRLPFLDYRLVEFAFGLPDALKLRDGYTKYALRRAMRDDLPAWLTDQRRKQRFAAPYHRWFQGGWRRLIEDYFLAGAFDCQAFLDVPRFRAVLRAYLKGDRTTMSAETLWRILNTEVWLRAFRAPGVDR